MSTKLYGRHTAASVLVLAMLGSLFGCGAKPPGCADPRTLDVATHMVLDGVHKAGGPVTKYSGILPKLWAEDPDHLFAKFAEEVNVTISAITSEGYDSNARRNTCQGTLEVSKPAGFSVPIQYTTQMVADSSDQFVLRTSDIGDFIASVQGAAINYWQWRRYADAWGGIYECSGLDGATSGPKGPYSMNVVAKVDQEWNVILERVTRGGGAESLKGKIGDGGKVSLSGTGQNSPEDNWTTSFQGAIEGRMFKAVGQINAEGGVSRSCRLVLERGREVDTSARTETAPGAVPPQPASAPAPTTTSVSATADSAGATPSFDCRRAATPVERMVCGSESLARLDARMADQYRASLATAADKEGLRAAQSAWRKQQRDVCADEACLAAAYQRRLAELDR